MSYYDQQSHPHQHPQHQQMPPQQQQQQQQYPPYGHQGTPRASNERSRANNRGGSQSRPSRSRTEGAAGGHDGVGADIVVVVAVDMFIATLDHTGRIQHLPEDVVRERFSIEPNWSFDDISRYLATLPGATGCHGWPRGSSPAFNQAKVTFGLHHRKITNEQNWNNLLSSVANGAKAMSITVMLPIGPNIAHTVPSLHDRMALDSGPVPSPSAKRKDPDTSYSSVRHNGNSVSSKRPHLDEASSRHNDGRRPQSHSQQYPPQQQTPQDRNRRRPLSPAATPAVSESMIKEHMAALQKAYIDDEDDGKFSLKLGDRRLYLNDSMLNAWAVSIARDRDGSTLVRPPPRDDRFDPSRAVPYFGASGPSRTLAIQEADWTSMSVKQLSEHEHFSNHFTEDLVKTVVNDVGVVSMVALQKLWKLGDSEKMVPKAGQRMEIDVVLDKWEAKIKEAVEKRKQAEEDEKRRQEERRAEHARREAERAAEAERRQAEREAEQAAQEAARIEAEQTRIDVDAIDDEDDDDADDAVEDQSQIDEAASGEAEQADATSSAVPPLAERIKPAAHSRRRSGPRPRLTPEERHRRLEGNLCIVCGSDEHLRPDCPHKGKPRTHSDQREGDNQDLDEEQEEGEE